LTKLIKVQKEVTSILQILNSIIIKQYSESITERKILVSFLKIVVTYFIVVIKFSEFAGPCTAWNVSVHEYEESRIDGVGKILHTFCPRDRSKEHSLPWKMNTVLLR
jgi:hypothetical protein